MSNIATKCRLDVGADMDFGWPCINATCTRSWFESRVCDQYYYGIRPLSLLLLLIL